MADVVYWLVTVEALGLASLPLAWWLFRTLPDRGLPLAKPLGWLLAGYVVWLGSSLGFLANRRATAVAAILVLGAIAWQSCGRETVAWLREHWRPVAAAEAVFLGFFALEAGLRAYDAAIIATEKPMDFAFLNAALRNEAMPPQDPWLAGYGISYYYFGYFLVALLAKVAGTPPAVAYNLALATLFGMVAAGAYSLVHNLAAGRSAGAGERACRATVAALAGPVFVLLLANLEGALEVLHNNAALPVEFWRWLGIRDLLSPRQGPQWFPTDPPDTWWWWRASRVVGDFDPVSGTTRDYTINEFPFFSFLLGDLHPHVMALPFVVLALALALALLREPRELTFGWFRTEKARTAAYVVCFGALGFLNSWDLPTLLLLLSLCVAAQRALVGERGALMLLQDAATFGAVALLLVFVAYLPFYIGLRSQASGIGIVAVRTKLPQFLVFWGPLLVTAAALPLVALGRPARKAGLAVSAWTPWLVGAALLGSVGLALAGAETLGVLLALGAVTWLALWRGVFGGAKASAGVPSAPAGDGDGKVAREDIFALALAAVAVLLLAVCEVLFVRDSFGSRMNTVFKLYYQAWLLLAVASAYTIYYLDLRRRVGRWRWPALAGYHLWRGAATALLVCGFAYTALAPLSKTGFFAGPPSLDGLAWLRQANPQQWGAIAWLASQEGTPVILEASGPEYSQFNLVSAFSGLPSVLGWAGHEYQWRGNTPEPARRKADVDSIYQTADAKAAEQLLRRYGVTFVVVGDAERQAYAGAPAGALTKFARFMDVVYQNERVAIYRLR